MKPLGSMLVIWGLFLCASFEATVLPELTFSDETEGALGAIKVQPGQKFSLSSYPDHPSMQPLLQGSESASPQFMIHGMEPHQNRVFLDGIPLTDPVYNSDHLILVPSAISSIWEVFPSGAPAFFLGDGTAGAINILLDKPLGNRQVSFQRGSFESTRLAGVVSDALGGQLGFDWSQSSEKFQFRDTNGTPFNSQDDFIRNRENNGFSRVSILPFWIFRPASRVFIKIFSLNAIQNIEVPGPISSPMNKALRGVFHLTAIKSKWSLSPDVRADGNVYLRILDEKLTDNLQNQSESSDFLTVGVQSKLAWSGSRKELGCGLGGDFSIYRWESDLNESGRSKYQQINAPFFLDSKWELLESRLKFTPELLGSFQHLNSDKGQKSFVELSPRLSIQSRIYQRIKWAVAMGYYYRNPSLSELMGSPKNFLANPALQTERSLKLDLKLKFFENEFGIYAARTSNVIQTKLIQKGLAQSENLGRAVFLGAEGISKVRLSKVFFASGGASILYAQNRSESDPDFKKMLSLRFPFKSHIQVDYVRQNWRAGARTSFFSSSYLDSANLRRMDPYFIHDLFAETELNFGGKLELSIQNILDLTRVRTEENGNEYEEEIGGWSDYPAAGRRINLRLTVSF